MGRSQVEEMKTDTIRLPDKRAIDTKVYEEEIRPWLPPEIIDCHVHIGLEEHCGPVSEERRKEIWAIEVGLHQTWEELRNSHRTLFPDRQVQSLVFGNVYREADIESGNAYVLNGALDPRNDAEALLVTRPEWNPKVVAEAISVGFVGIKPYPDLVAQGMNEAAIYDFVPRGHLSVLNQLSGILMLHLPRPGRLADPQNIRDLLEISEQYPSIKMIVAHIGRAYCLPTARLGLPYLAERDGIYFDLSANLNTDVFEYALEMVGPERLLFGSDLPVMMIRGQREHFDDKYVNYTNGPYSWNVNRKDPEEESRYTFYVYEQLRALIKAVTRLGLGREAMEKMLYSNSKSLLDRSSNDRLQVARSATVGLRNAFRARSH